MRRGSCPVAGHRLLELLPSGMYGSHQPSRLSREGFTIYAFAESAEGYSHPAKGKRHH